MKQDIKIIAYQFNPTVGDISTNSQTMMQYWERFNSDNTLLVFPELSLCGYPPEDLVLNSAFIDTLDLELQKILQFSKKQKSAALIPTVLRVQGELYNVVHFVWNGKIEQTIIKHTLPNYAVFDEERIFEAGPRPQPVEFKGHKIGVIICEDLWNPKVPKHLHKNGAEILISINASPFYKEKEEVRKTIARENTAGTDLDLIYLNMIGGQDELVFDGRSFAMNANGDIVYQAPAFRDTIIEFTLDTNSKLSAPGDIITYDETALTYEALKIGLHDYVRKNGFKKVLLGLSGGIDSALTAAIAADCLGPENVQCIMLPSEFTSQDSLDDAKECAELLNISDYSIIPINDPLKAFETTIPSLSGIAHENTQSRIRGTILMAVSNSNGALLITTGNKSEVAVGYCTLYGDMNGAFNPLKDVYKTEVYKLAKWRNEQSTAIPERIITKAPSAELREDQKDQDSLPPYDLLDDILMLLVEYDDVNWDHAPDELLELQKRCLEHPDEVKKIAKLLKNSEFKRFQAAPGTRITPRAFGRDRRYPLTNHFVNKIEKQS